jgi:ABC-type dipeptide/oligopeptide/nickel transport system ATPase component
MFNITEFNIYGLHGDKDIKLKLEDNILILVGENGAYKTTIVSLFYGLLDYNTVFLDKYSYRRLEMVIDGNKFYYDNGFKHKLFPCGADLYKNYYNFNMGDYFNCDDADLSLFLASPRLESFELLDELCAVCNRYLVGKKLDYIPRQKVLYLIEKREDSDEKDFATEVPHTRLSDAERKLLYIFFKLYLNNVKFFLIIDEIERGFSVKWQRTILEDIKKAPSFAGMVVTTHSPFVFSNSLRKYAHGVGEFLYKKENK